MLSLFADDVGDKTLAALCFATFVAMLGIGLVSPLLPIYASELGASSFEIGLVVTAWALPYALLQIPFGRLSDRFGRRPPILIGLFGYALSSYLYVLAWSMRSLLAARALHGLFAATIWPASTAAVADLSPEDRRGRAYGAYSFSFIGGIAMGPVVGGYLAHALGFFAPFYFCTALALAGLAIAALWVRETLSQRSRSSSLGDVLLSRPALLGNRDFVLVCAALCVLMMARGVMIAQFPIYAAQPPFYVDVFGIGAILTAQAIASTIVQPPLGWVVDSVGRKPVLVAGFALTAISFVQLFSAHTVLELWELAAVQGVGLGMVVLSTAAIVADVSPSVVRGEAMGTLNLIRGLGWAFGPAAVGAFVDWAGLRAAFALCSVILVASVLIALFVRETKPS